jgi:3-phosphoglycerate kinase
VVIGGAKVRDKIGVLQALVASADVLLIGGRMAFTFLAAEGVACGKTQIEEDWLEVGCCKSEGVRVREWRESEGVEAGNMDGCPREV